MYICTCIYAYIHILIRAVCMHVPSKLKTCIQQRADDLPMPEDAPVTRTSAPSRWNCEVQVYD